ncbi:MAG: hypothetical protein LBH58_12235 [Tannerellaceae bacterium]|jgi:hypothetical protein|nr:hypothetical protein [Tannerellaceae bacterium]
MEIIINNPYRIIGILAGTTMREQQRQIKRLIQFIEAEQEIQDDFSFPELARIKRTVDNVSDAASKLNLDTDKVSAALFWFYKGNEITDEPAFEALKGGDVESSRAIWGKLTSSGEVTRKNASAYQNLSTLLLLLKTEEFKKGIQLKLKFLESNFVTDYIRQVADTTYKLSQDELQLLFLNQLYGEIEKSKEITTANFLEVITDQHFLSKEAFLKGFVVKLVDSVEKKCEEIRIKREHVAKNSLSLGKQLHDETIGNLDRIKLIVGSSDLKYVSVADKVATEILQCGIKEFDIYNESGKGSVTAIQDIYKKAQNVAAGNLIKQRCREKSEELQQWIEDKPKREKEDKIKADLVGITSILERLKNDSTGLNDKKLLLKQAREIVGRLKSVLGANDNFYKNVLLEITTYELLYIIKKFENERSTIYNALSLIGESKSVLNTLKSELGVKNDTYLQASTRIASDALSFVIAEFNSMANQGGSRYTIENTVKEAAQAIVEIGKLDMTKDFLIKRFKPNSKVILETSSKLSGRKSFSPCYIATMAYGDFNHPQVVVLRQFRDEVLERYTLGKLFIRVYYAVSPKLVLILKDSKTINSVIRKVLNQFVKYIKK